jgi:hypothetical protein
LGEWIPPCLSVSVAENIRNTQYSQNGCDAVGIRHPDTAKMARAVHPHRDVWVRCPSPSLSLPPVSSSWAPPRSFLTFSGLIGIAYDGSATRDSRARHDGHLRPGFFLQTCGYRHFTYLRAHQIIFATILERMIFHEIPTPLSQCGILIIMSSAIYVAVSRVFVYLSIMLDELHGRPFFKFFSFYILVGFLTAAVHS